MTKSRWLIEPLIRVLSAYLIVTDAANLSRQTDRNEAEFEILSGMLGINAPGVRLGRFERNDYSNDTLYSLNIRVPEGYPPMYSYRLRLPSCGYEVRPLQEVRDAGSNYH